MSLSFKKQEEELPSATYTSLQETLVRQSAGQFSAETDEEPAAAQQAAALPENSRSDSAKAQQSAPVTFGTDAADGNAGNSAGGGNGNGIPGRNFASGGSRRSRHVPRRTGRRRCAAGPGSAPPGR